jgi:cobyrinic acid a,c-diamide synthase
VSGHVVDEDAAFVIEGLGLNVQPWEISPVVVTEETLRDRLAHPEQVDLMQHVQSAMQNVGANVDVMLIEGGSSLREGYIFGLPSPLMAEALGSPALMVVKYRDTVRLMDDSLASATRYGTRLAGVIINRVPEEARRFVVEEASPALERHGICVMGILPERRPESALRCRNW